MDSSRALRCEPCSRNIVIRKLSLLETSLDKSIDAFAQSNSTIHFREKWKRVVWVNWLRDDFSCPSTSVPGPMAILNSIYSNFRLT